MKNIASQSDVSGYLGDNGSIQAEINQIEVLVSHRNCGKASKLLEKMISLVDKSITLEVKIDNLPAINLYKKYNFVEKAIRKGYYNGIDGILMERINN